MNSDIVSTTQRTRCSEQFNWLLPTLHELGTIRGANCNCTCADNLHFHCSLFYVISYSWDEYRIQQLIYKAFALNNHAPFLLEELDWRMDVHLEILYKELKNEWHMCTP